MALPKGYGILIAVVNPPSVLGASWAFSFLRDRASELLNCRKHSALEVATKTPDSAAAKGGCSGSPKGGV